MRADLGQLILEQYHERVTRLWTAMFSGLVSNPVYLEKMARDSLDIERSRRQLLLVEETSKTQLRGKRILEVGAGLGLTVAVARLGFGADAYGIEPGFDSYEGSNRVGHDLLGTCGISPDTVLACAGESLPFRDQAFDVVHSSNVLEHVRDPAAVIRESIRVLRPRGILHFVVPNYGSWWEGHYGIPWFPSMPRWLARLYIRALGRDVAFLDTLQLVNRRMLERILKPHKENVRVISWGTELWEHRVRTLDFAEYHTLDKVKHVLKLLHKLKVIDLLVRAGKRLHWETPIVLCLERR